MIEGRDGIYRAETPPEPTIPRVLLFGHRGAGNPRSLAALSCKRVKRKAKFSAAKSFTRRLTCRESAKRFIPERKSNRIQAN